MGDDKPFYEPAEGEGNDKPCFELYIKASSIDGESKGSCPLCQQWFMIAYLLAEQKNVSFRVFTVQASMPPKSFTDKTRSKMFPVVIGLSGKDSMAQHITDMVCDSSDEVEVFFERVNFSCPKLKRPEMTNAVALKIFEDLYKDFNAMLQSPGEREKNKVRTDLRNLNHYLEEQGFAYLTGSTLAYSDCVLLPKLQHIRAAGKGYCDFEIPNDFTAIWTYLERAYKTQAFSATLPSDQDIMLQYEQKAATKPLKGSHPTLQQRTFSTEIPIHTDGLPQPDGVNGSD